MAVAVAVTVAVMGATAVVGEARAGAMQQQPEQLGQQQPQHVVRCVTSNDRRRSTRNGRTSRTFGKSTRTPATLKGGARSMGSRGGTLPPSRGKRGILYDIRSYIILHWKLLHLKLRFLLQGRYIGKDYLRKTAGPNPSQEIGASGWGHGGETLEVRYQNAIRIEGVCA